jgi:hypothetical protein
MTLYSLYVHDLNKRTVVCSDLYRMKWMAYPANVCSVLKWTPPFLGCRLAIGALSVTAQTGALFLFPWFRWHGIIARFACGVLAYVFWLVSVEISAAKWQTIVKYAGIYFVSKVPCGGHRVCWLNEEILTSKRSRNLTRVAGHEAGVFFGLAFEIYWSDSVQTPTPRYNFNHYFGIFRSQPPEQFAGRTICQLNVVAYVFIIDPEVWVDPDGDYCASKMT